MEQDENSKILINNLADLFEENIDEIKDENIKETITNLVNERIRIQQAQNDNNQLENGKKRF